MNSLHQFKKERIKNILTLLKMKEREDRIEIWLKDEYKAWYKNGAKFIHVFYKDGKKNGKHISYFPSGSIKRDCEYKDNILHGVYSAFYHDGKPLRYFVYRNGNIHGKMIGWDKYGELDMEGFYTEGIRDGEFKEWDLGNLISHCMYKNGKIIKDFFKKRVDDVQ